MVKCDESRSRLSYISNHCPFVPVLCTKREETRRNQSTAGFRRLHLFIAALDRNDKLCIQQLQQEMLTTAMSCVRPEDFQRHSKTSIRWRILKSYGHTLARWLPRIAMSIQTCVIFLSKRNNQKTSTRLFNVFLRGWCLHTCIFICIFIYIYIEIGEWPFQALRPLLWDLRSCARIKFDHFEAGSRFERSKRSSSHGSFHAPTYRQMMSYGGTIGAKD